MPGKCPSSAASVICRIQIRNPSAAAPNCPSGSPGGSSSSRHTCPVRTLLGWRNRARSIATVRVASMSVRCRRNPARRSRPRQAPSASGSEIARSVLGRSPVLLLVRSVFGPILFRFSTVLFTGSIGPVHRFGSVCWSGSSVQLDSLV